MNDDAMNDDKLKRAWRAATAASAQPIIDAEALAGLAQGGGSVGERDAALGAVGESALNADLLATLRALSLDAESLSTAVAGVRQSVRVTDGRSRAPQRRWLALAAGVAAVAVTVTAVRQSAPDPAARAPTAEISSVVVPVNDLRSEVSPSDRGHIMTASFDEAGSSSPAQEIFLGDFDS